MRDLNIAENWSIDSMLAKNLKYFGHGHSGLERTVMEVVVSRRRGGPVQIGGGHRT